MNTQYEDAIDLPLEALHDLSHRLTGTIVTPADEEYGGARTIWNAMIASRPAAIAFPETTRDVAALIRFAVAERLPLAIRGGGHNIAGSALADGGLTIHMGRMKSVDYDATTGRVRVGAGATWADVDAALEPFGLIVPGGVVSTTGVAGFTLGGGFGWLTRSEGYTSERLTAATIVTADGQIREIDAFNEPDLFWAIRGGGGNFGVVTSFEFEPVRLGPEIAGGVVFWPIERAPEIIDLFRRESAAAPAELTHVLVLRIAPPAPFLPEEFHGKPIVGIAAMYAGPVDEGIAALEPIMTYGEPLANTIKPKPYREHQAFLDSGQPFGRRYYWKSVYFDDFSDGVKDALLAYGTSFRSPFSSILLPHLGGVGTRDADEATATSHRGREFLVSYQASWEDPNLDTHLIDWARENHASLMPFATGHYVNFMTEDEIRDPARAAFEPALLARLQQIKAIYDPANVFRLNKNITPAEVLSPGS
ncbi:MAG: FAD-binding oxidoreductase [Thermomicrobiales bacterium]|nr:FAD-binding oxidoreductase [Thermomicrobiales bacterium]